MAVASLASPAVILFLGQQQRVGDQRECVSLGCAAAAMAVEKRDDILIISLRRCLSSILLHACPHK